MPAVPERVFVVGLMGAGKSTVGAALAERLDREYLDNDVELTRAQGEGAVALAQHGPDALHEAEAVYVESLFVHAGPFVASLPASVADRPALATALNDSGFVVYLRAHPDVLADRVVSDPVRPWLASEARATLHTMFGKRDSVFRLTSDLQVEVDLLSPVEIVDLVVAAFSTAQ
jgi:shikimate kinase